MYFNDSIFNLKKNSTKSAPANRLITPVILADENEKSLNYI